MQRMARRKLELGEALGQGATDKRLEILRRVGAGGSISQAARDAGVSYKAAWQALDTLSNLAGVPLVERLVGGSGGGGARLTAAGRKLLGAADDLAQARQQVLERLAGRRSPVASLGVRTSMRNQLVCTVEGVDVLGPLARVTLAVAGGARLVARITADSAELLGLAAGQEVLALCKATAVQVLRSGTPEVAAAGMNTLEGKASRVARSEAADEVAAQLPGGPALVGFAVPRSGLRAGSRVWLRIDESAVVIALPG